jgi:hypothetical protein
MQAQKSWSFQFPGVRAFSSSGTNTVSFVGTVTIQKTLAALVAAQTGTLTTRTDDDTGEATLSTGHGITTGVVVDIYWAGGVRYGVTVGTVAGNVVPFGAPGGTGSGDALPVQTTAVTVVVQTTIEVNFDGDDAQIIGIFYSNPSDTGANAHLDLQDSGNASIEEIDLVHDTANGADDGIYDIANGDTNVFTGNRITKGKASHDSTSAGTLYILVGITAP